MRVIHGNCGSLPAIGWELASAVRNDEELNNLFSCITITQGQTSIKSDFHRIKKYRWIQEPCHN